MPFRHAFAISAIALACSPAMANPLEKSLAADGSTCWERVYDAAHLKSHPRQQVVKIRLSTDVQDDGTIVAALGMNLRKRIGDPRLDYATTGFCKARGAGIVCTPEWESGTFTIERGKGETVLVRNGGLIMNPAAHAAEEIAPGAIDLGKTDDASWRLNRIDSGCEVY